MLIICLLSRKYPLCSLSKTALDVFLLRPTNETLKELPLLGGRIDSVQWHLAEKRVSWSSAQAELKTNLQNKEQISFRPKPAMSDLQIVWPNTCQKLRLLILLAWCWTWFRKVFHKLRHHTRTWEKGPCPKLSPQSRTTVNGHRGWIFKDT